MDQKEPVIQKVAEETARNIEQGLTGVAPPDGGDGTKKKRTWGNKIFDMIVWPVTAFGVVFAFSVWATHKGTFGEGRVKKAFDGLAEAIRKTPLVNKSLPLEKQADLAQGHAQVLISFLAGTGLMAPVKWFEDARGKISKSIDGVLGTTPDDPSHYAKEPKQSWKSVLGGRVITFASILTLSKLVGDHIIDAAHALANKTAGVIAPVAKGNWAARRAAGTKWQVHFVSAFEGFYTALCAVSVYAISRGLARSFNKKEERQAPVASATPESAPADAPAAAGNAQWQEKSAVREQPKKAENFVQTVDGSRAALASAPAIG